MALPAGRKGVLPSELTPEGKLKLPTASAEVLGGVKVGNGLSITDDVLSVSGDSGSKYIHTIKAETNWHTLIFQLITSSDVIMSATAIKEALVALEGKLIMCSGQATYQAQGTHRVIAGFVPTSTSGSLQLYLCNSDSGNWLNESVTFNFTDMSVIQI